MSIRSGVLVAFNTPAGGGNATIATVQSTDTWILKDVALFNNNAAAITAEIYIARVSGQKGYLFSGQSIQSVGVFRWTGWIVAGPSDTIHLFTSSGVVNVWISGADLPGHI